MRTFAMAGSLSRGSSALFLHPKYDVLLLTAKPVWQCGLSLLVRDVRSHGPGIPKCGISAGSGGRFGVFEAKVVRIPRQPRLAGWGRVIIPRATASAETCQP